MGTYGIGAADSIVHHAGRIEDLDAELRGQRTRRWAGRVVAHDDLEGTAGQRSGHGAAGHAQSVHDEGPLGQRGDAHRDNVPVTRR